MVKAKLQKKKDMLTSMAVTCNKLNHLNNEIGPHHPHIYKQLSISIRVVTIANFLFAQVLNHENLRPKCFLYFNLHFSLNNEKSNEKKEKRSNLET